MWRIVASGEDNPSGHLTVYIANQHNYLSWFYNSSINQSINQHLLTSRSTIITIS